MHNSLHTREDIDYICKEKKELEESLELRTDWMRQSRDSRTTLKEQRKRVTALAT